MKISGRTIELDGNELAHAVYVYLYAMGVVIDGSRTVSLAPASGGSRTLAKNVSVSVYVDPSGRTLQEGRIVIDREGAATASSAIIENGTPASSSAAQEEAYWAKIWARDLALSTSAEAEVRSAAAQAELEKSARKPSEVAYLVMSCGRCDGVGTCTRVDGVGGKWQERCDQCHGRGTVEASSKPIEER